MCDCFRDRTIQIEQHSKPRGPPIKSYQFVRSLSTNSPPSLPTTTIIRRPSPEIKPAKDTFQPPEGDDFYPHRDHRVGQTPTFHPLPPVIHQHHPPQHQQQPQNGRLLGALEPPRTHNNRPLEWADNGTLIIDDHPERAVARLPKRDSRGRRVVRVHRSHPHASRSLSQSTRPGSNGARSYYHHDGSEGTSGDWDADSWAEGESGRGTVKSEWGEWSDGGDSWDGGRRDRRRVEGGRRDGGGKRGYYLN